MVGRKKHIEFFFLILKIKISTQNHTHTHWSIVLEFTDYSNYDLHFEIVHEFDCTEIDVHGPIKLNKCVVFFGERYTHMYKFGHECGHLQQQN